MIILGGLPRRARRGIWFWSLTAVLLLGLALPARASAETVLGSINVPLSETKLYTAPLVAGGVYRIAASGTYTQSGGPSNPVDRDALYCFNYVASPPAGCSPAAPVRQYPVAVRYEGDTSTTADLDALNPATTLAYSPVHTYQETFTAASSTRLEVFCRMCNPFYSYAGGIRLDFFLVSLPSGGSSGGPSGGSGGGTPAGATDASPLLLPSATAWGAGGAVTGTVAPGGVAAVESPKLARGQTKASVTIQIPDVQKVIAHIPLKARDCLYAYFGGVTFKQRFIDQGKIPVELLGRNLNGKILFDGEKDPTLLYLGFLACLEAAKQFEQPPAAGASARAAARTGCRTSAPRLKLTVRNPSTVLYGIQRPSRRGDARRLRVSCRASSNALTVSVRTRSRRTKLRSVVGKRLRIGLYRSAKATGDGKLRATFKR